MAYTGRRKRSYAQTYMAKVVSPAKRARVMQAVPIAYKRPYRRYGKSSGYVDKAVATYPLNTTGTVALIPTIGQGSSVNQRIGKKIRFKSIQIRGSVMSDSTTVACTGAIMLVYDKRPTGTLPGVTDILVTANSQSFNNDTNSGRFQIVRRWDWSFSGNTTTAGQQTEKSIQCMNEFVNFNRKCTFKALGTGAIADIEEGALYVVSVGDVASGTADASAVLGFRTRFSDVDG